MLFRLLNARHIFPIIWFWL